MSSNEPIRVGTRRSALAKVQTDWVVERLSAAGLVCQIIEITSEGDQDQTKPLYEIESKGPGLFTKRLEQALIDREIDVAVHSLKDLPTVQPASLMVAAIPTREDARDVLVCHEEALDPKAPWGIREGACVGTSSLRREALLLSQAKLDVVSLRGNVPTRVRAVESGAVHAAVLALAGLRRLDLDIRKPLVVVELDERRFVSAPGQGALAIEVRTDLSPSVLKQISSLQDSVTAEETMWERYVLRQLEGGCTLPLGVRCYRRGGSWDLFVFLGLGDAAAGSSKKRWSEFHRRSWSGDKIQIVANEAVSYFLDVMKRHAASMGRPSRK